VHKALDAEAKKVQGEIAKTEAYVKRRQDAGELRRAADETDDPELKTALRKRAASLEEPLPVGEVIEGQPKIKTEPTGKIPVGQTREGQPKIKTEKTGKLPVGEATEATPEQLAAWRKEHGLGAEDAARAKGVADAFDKDPEATAAAAAKHENDPVAFDREIERINAKEKPDADETKQATRGGESNAASDQDRPQRDAAPAVPADAGDTGAHGAGSAGRGGGEAGAASGQAAGGVEIREVPGGFEAWKDGKKVGYLKDNLERGQAAQIDENANVNMVKVLVNERRPMRHYLGTMPEVLSFAPSGGSE
jgi:hypothetical protein